MTDSKSDNWQPFERVAELAIAMTAIPSVTGSDDEASFADHLLPVIRAIPYFRDHPDHVMVLDSHGEPKRKNIVLLVAGSGPRTLTFCGHYDTVATDNYLDLQHVACQPGRLGEALLADLRSRPLSASEHKALVDLESGHFMAGRGLLDMKSGDAAGLAVLEHMAQSGPFLGNLLLMMTPDEEGGSAGIRALRAHLPDIADRFGLEIEAAINLDATSDQGDGEGGRAIYRGSIGKYLPFAFVLGRAAHAAYPFEGVSAHRMASALVSAIEANPALCDRAGDEICPPPVCLGLRDDREAYDVTMPDRVFMAFNWLSANWSAETLLGKFNSVCENALADVLAGYAESGRTYAALQHQPAPTIPEGRVINLAELRQAAFEKADDKALADLSSLEAELARLPNPVEASRRMVSHLATLAGVEGPLVVTGLASLHYPAVHIGRTPEASRTLVEAIEAARNAQFGAGEPPIIWRDWFMGISDMSFLGHRPQAQDLSILSENTALGHLVDRPPERILSFPCVNIGPWGREYHQRLERVHAPYAFDQLPRFLADIARRFLSGPPDA